MLGSVAFVLSVECACTFVCVCVCVGGGGGGYVWVCGWVFECQAVVPFCVWPWFERST